MTAKPLLEPVLCSSRTRKGSSPCFGLLCYFEHVGRSLCANLAAANNFALSHLEEEKNAAVWKAASFYYMAGFFFTVSQPSIMTVARYAHENKKTVAINLSAPFIPQFFGAGIAEVMPFVDIVFGNESEAEAYGSLSLTRSLNSHSLYVKALPTEPALTPLPLSLA